MSNIKVGVVGALGKMGREVVKAVCNNENTELVLAVDMFNVGSDIGEIVFNKKIDVKIEADLKLAIESKNVDVIVDFTQPSTIYNNAKIILNSKVNLVVGTTGLTDEQLEELKTLTDKNQVSTLIAPNFSTGAVLLMMFSKMAAKYFDNAEIIELHHNQKKDAPSGTAIKTAKMIASVKDNFEAGNCEEVELIKGARGAKTESNVRVHSVRMPGFIASEEVIFGENGQILTLRHDSMNRECYMKGVLLSIDYVFNHKEFVYGLENILSF